MRSARLSAEPLSTSYSMLISATSTTSATSALKRESRSAENQTTAAVSSACVFVPREPRDVSPSAWIGDISCLGFSSKLLGECHEGK